MISCSSLYYCSSEVASDWRHYVVMSQSEDALFVRNTLHFVKNPSLHTDLCRFPGVNHLVAMATNNKKKKKPPKKEIPNQLYSNQK